jgi:hypothetical protein
VDNRRLFMFNAGCADEECCGEDDDEEPCEDICVTVRNFSTNALVDGATVTWEELTWEELGHGDVILDTQVTGPTGRVCFGPPEPGKSYVFRASKTGLASNAMIVSYTEEDCDTVKEVTIKLKGNRPPGCVDVTVNNCGCKLRGATVTLEIPAYGFTATDVTDWFGVARVCVTGPAASGEGGYTITVTHPDIETFVWVDIYHWIFDPIPVTHTFATVQVDDEQRFCYRDVPDGTSGVNCIEYAPNTLSVTLMGDWPAGVGGGHTLFQDPSDYFTWYTGCLGTPDTSFFRTYGIRVQTNQGPFSCGVKGNATITVAFNQSPPDPMTGECVTAAGDSTFAGNSVAEPGGSSACPIAFFTGFTREAPFPPLPYTTARTATVTE